MTSLLDHLWSKILGRTTVSSPSLGFVFSDKVRPAEISELDCAIPVQENVLGFDISMDNRRVLSVTVLDGAYNFSKILGGYGLLESAFSFQKRVNLATGGIL